MDSYCSTEKKSIIAQQSLLITKGTRSEFMSTSRSGIMLAHRLSLEQLQQ